MAQWVKTLPAKSVYLSLSPEGHPHAGRGEPTLMRTYTLTPTCKLFTNMPTPTPTPNT